MLFHISANALGLNGFNWDFWLIPNYFVRLIPKVFDWKKILFLIWRRIKKDYKEATDHKISWPVQNVVESISMNRKYIAIKEVEFLFRFSRSDTLARTGYIDTSV